MSLCRKIAIFSTILTLLVAISTPIILQYVPAKVIAIHVQLANDAFDSIMRRGTALTGSADDASSSSLVNVEHKNDEQKNSEPLSRSSLLSKSLPPCPTTFTLTPAELSKYTDHTLPHPSPEFAHRPRPLLIALKGVIFDVTEGHKFYGPGAPYNVFAGKRCGRALTLGSLDDKDMTDDLTGMTDKELKAGESIFYFLPLRAYSCASRFAPCS